jgi:dihydrofolate reductase
MRVEKEDEPMRKINVLTFVTMDGVMQAPGGPEEDTSGGFRHGGWLVGYFDEFLGQEMAKQMGQEFDLLLGRRTYDIFASHWPNVTDPSAAPINKATKYVATNRPFSTDWNKTSVRLEGDVAEAVRKLKSGSGREIQVHGSGTLIQTLLKNDLVDELWLKTSRSRSGAGASCSPRGHPTRASRSWRAASHRAA